MVIVTIIGILATLVYSRYNYHVAKTRQAEAKHNLNHIISLQDTFILEHNRYSWLKSIGRKRHGGTPPHACGESTPGEEMRNELGFRPKNCKELRYEYWMPSKSGDPSKPRSNIDGNSPSFMIRADNIPGPNKSDRYIWPDCDQRDWWKAFSDPQHLDSANHPDHGKKMRVYQPYDHTPPRNVLEACK